MATQVADLDEVRMDQLVFNQIADAKRKAVDGLDEQIVRFSILATMPITRLDDA